jgi:hypothetical protein
MPTMHPALRMRLAGRAWSWGHANLPRRDRCKTLFIARLRLHVAAIWTTYWSSWLQSGLYGMVSTLHVFLSPTSILHRCLAAGQACKSICSSQMEFRNPILSNGCNNTQQEASSNPRWNTVVLCSSTTAARPSLPKGHASCCLLPDLRAALVDIVLNVSVAALFLRFYSVLLWFGFSCVRFVSTSLYRCDPYVSADVFHITYFLNIVKY